MNDEGYFQYFKNAVPFTLKSKYNVNQKFTDHLWIGRDEAQNQGICMTNDCKKGHQFWLSKADGSLVSGPYVISHNNPSDGSVPNTSPVVETYFISSRVSFTNSENYEYRVGDLLYFQQQDVRSINWNSNMRGFYWCGVGGGLILI